MGKPGYVPFSERPEYNGDRTAPSVLSTTTVDATKIACGSHETQRVETKNRMFEGFVARKRMQRQHSHTPAP